MSGSQLTGNLERHYLSETSCESRVIESNRLFPLESKKDVFISGMKRFRKIVVLAAAHTTAGAQKLSKCLMERLSISADGIEVKGANLADSECYLDRSTKISLAAKNQLKQLGCDKPRLKRLFKFDDEDSYDDSLSSLKDANLIVRPNSVPKKGLQLFILQPLNRFIPPLFCRIEEHH